MFSYVGPVIVLAHIAQSVEHFLGKEEVTGSNPVMSSSFYWCEWELSQALQFFLVRMEIKPGAPVLSEVLIVVKVSLIINYII